MKKITNILVILAIVLGIATLLPLNAQAYTLVPGGPGMAGFYGWEDYNFSGTGGSVDANVFFAVFAPGDSNNPYSTLYTYAYLIQNTAASTAISQFTVGVLPGFIGTIANVGSAAMADIWDIGGAGDLAPAGAPSPPFYQTDDAGIVPSSAVTGPSSVIYSFGGATGFISPGAYSLTLLYTSTFPPTTVTGSLQDGGSSQFNTVPGPAPEPASLALLGLGILGLFGLKMKRA